MGCGHDSEIARDLVEYMSSKFIWEEDMPGIIQGRKFVAKSKEELLWRVFRLTNEG